MKPEAARMIGSVSGGLGAFVSRASSAGEEVDTAASYDLLATSNYLRKYLRVSSNLQKKGVERPGAEPPEPDPMTPAEFDAWRGMLRLHATVTRELEQRLLAEHGMSLSHYGVLITLVGAPEQRLRMSELAERRLTHPSGVTRVVDQLEKQGLVSREVDHGDGRSFHAVLTRAGLERLREAQLTHHAVARELYLGRLSERDAKQLAGLFEKALPGVVSEPVWPPPRRESPARPV
jgi:DNA-binding MarR family transcriptional regulator